MKNNLGRNYSVRFFNKLMLYFVPMMVYSIGFEFMHKPRFVAYIPLQLRTTSEHGRLE
jgi:hypothetical protein